jgi:hypothetical protein
MLGAAGFQPRGADEGRADAPELEELTPVQSDAWRRDRLVVGGGL